MLVTACASSPTVRYYVLTPEKGSAASAVNASALSVAVGPVTVPDLMDQPSIVVKAEGNQVTLQEYHRWASALPSEIASVIVANLSQELGAPRVWSYQQTSMSSPDVQVPINVRRFDAVLGKGVTIDALWSIRRKAGQAVKAGQSVVHEPESGGDINDLVAAYSRALARVSREIASAIRTP